MSTVDLQHMMNFFANNWPEILSITVAVVSFLLTITLSKREKPSLMPAGSSINIEIGRLALDWKNVSDFNLYDLTILVSGFDSSFNSVFFHQDKYNFPIAKDAVFNYGWNLNEYAKDTFYFRARFKGIYRTRFPFWNKKSFEQHIWYTMTKHAEKKENEKTKIFFSPDTTYKDELHQIEKKHGRKLAEEENDIDSKFKY